ncbi:amidohydrolase family protein [Brevundimonas sp.]|uniref:amidohydrolase family protein n=1 Tax=Brevundimonas sp. TaxID=1871086 RepID=UPI0037850081
MLIDAHQHVWRLDAPGHEWPRPDLPAIHRDFDLNDFWAVATPEGVTGTVLVQSQPNIGDTGWLLETASRDERVLGVVGWVDLAASDAAERIRELANHPKLRGLRPMLQSLSPDWICDPVLDPAVEAMLDEGLRFDALVRPEHLPGLGRFADRWPDLPIIIDHAAKPAIVSGGFEAWADAMAPLAENPRIVCKLSGLLTEASPDQGYDDLQPYIGHLVEMFGPERLMWGSDWPVVTQAATYGDWLAFARRAVSIFASGHEQAIFGGTALSFYGGFAEPVAARHTS